MSPPAATFSTALLPRPQERAIFANILLLLALPLAVYLAWLHASPDAEGVNRAQETALALLAYGALSAGTLLGWRRLLATASGRTRVDRLAAVARRTAVAAARAGRLQPGRTLWFVALAGVLVSCYPVVFCGKSFVSPNSLTELFYGQYPAVPNSPSPQYEWPAGSDVGAMAWQDMPYSVIQGRALFRDHELPVWNRYNNGGATLLGQGTSMIGDPLHLIPVLAGGASWAWDLKFLLARWLFAAGIGWCVWTATGRLGPACLLVFSACFFHFFTYRLNHPATFSLGYAPLILLAWLQIVRGSETPGGDGARAQLPRVALLLLGCWMELNSGTAKESAMLLVSLNGAGLLLLALDDRHAWRWKCKALVGLAWAGGCFVLVSAPVWRTLFEAILHSWSNYLKPEVWQLQPGVLIGLFDDIFYRCFNFNGKVLDPSANGVVLLGVACAVAFGGYLLRRRRIFLALALSAWPLFALVFGVVPPDWICAVPFIGNIIHVDNTFSCPLLVILPVLAGFGFERAGTLLAARRFAWRYAAVAAVPLLGLALFQGSTHAGQHSDFSPLAAVHGQLPLDSFFLGYVGSLLAAWLLWPLLARTWRVTGGAVWGVAPWMAVCLGALLWRGGVQEHSVVEAGNYVPYLGPRVDLRIQSTAVDRLVAATRAEPGRYLGLNNTIMTGYTATFDLEGPSGPDALQSLYFHRLLVNSGTPFRYTWQLVPKAEVAVATWVRRFYDLLNVRYYADRIQPGTNASPTVAGLRSLGRYDLDLYESPTAWPRAFFTDTLVPSVRVADLMSALRNGDGRPFAAVSPAELRLRPDLDAFAPLLRPPGGDAARTVVPARGYRLTSRTTTFHLRAPGPGMAVLMETYQSPYNAQAYLDGQPVEHLRVNEAFLGIRVGAGEHEVRVVYGPRDLPWLLGASALGLALLVATAWWIRRTSGERSATVAVRQLPLNLSPSDSRPDYLVPDGSPRPEVAV